MYDAHGQARATRGEGCASELHASRKSGLAGCMRHGQLVLMVDTARHARVSSIVARRCTDTSDRTKRVCLCGSSPAGKLDLPGIFNIQPASSTNDGCGSVADCKTGTGPGRFNVPLGSSGNNIRALCTPGHSCNNNVRTICAAGRAFAFAGGSSCAMCEAGSYSSLPGSSHCTPCPSYSQAHFAGSTGCLACFFGQPRLIAGILNGNNNPPFPDNMPAEQPSPGELGPMPPVFSAAPAACRQLFPATKTATCGLTVLPRPGCSCCWAQLGVQCGWGPGECKGFQPFPSPLHLT